MAYEVFTTPSGLTVLIDAVAGGNVQMGKLLQGADGSAFPLDKIFGTTVDAAAHSGIPPDFVYMLKPAPLTGFDDADSLTYHPAGVDRAGNQWVRVGPLRRASVMKQQTGITTATAFTASGGIPSDAVVALMQGEGGVWRYKDDGTDPTSTFGIKCADGEKVILDTDPLSDHRFIAVSGTLTLTAGFYK